jgi:hypothetical protein
MRTSKSGVATWALMAVAAVAGGLTVGCDKLLESSARQQDRQVETQLAESLSRREMGGKNVAAEVSKAVKAAESLANSASPIGKMRGKSELARDEVNQAMAELPEITGRSVQIEAALDEVRAAGAQVRALNRGAEVPAALEPKDAPQQASLEDLEKTRAASEAEATDADKNADAAAQAAQTLAGDAAAAKMKEAATFRAQAKAAHFKAMALAVQMQMKAAAMRKSAVMAELDKAKSAAAAAQADLDKRQQEINGLKEQRKAAQAEAETLTDKSNNTKDPEESVKLFRQAADVRTKADTLGAQIEMKTGALLPVQRALAMAQQQQQFWDNPSKDNPGALQQADARLQQFTADSQDSKDQVTASGVQAQKIVTSVINANNDKDHPNAGAKLAQLWTANEEKRTKVIALLESAIKHYGEASSAAGTYKSELSARITEIQNRNANAPELPPLRGLLGLYDKNQYELAKGETQNLLADVLADRATAQLHVANVADLLKDAGVKAEDWMAAIKPDFAKANDTYKAAAATLDPVANASANVDNLQTVKHGARLALAHAHLARWRLPSHDEDAKIALRGDIEAAKEASIDLPPQLRAAASEMAR